MVAFKCSFNLLLNLFSLLSHFTSFESSLKILSPLSNKKFFVLSLFFFAILKSFLVLVGYLWKSPLYDTNSFIYSGSSRWLLPRKYTSNHRITPAWNPNIFNFSINLRLSIVSNALFKSRKTARIYILAVVAEFLPFRQH